MHLRTVLLLLLGVAALAGLTMWQLARESERESQLDAPLMEGFDRTRVTALRLDNLERSLQMRIERGANGRWMIVDPIEFPAEAMVVEALFGALETQRLKPPLSTERSQVGLEPPRAVLEVVEDVGGKARTTRIEIGEVDLGGQLVYALRDGRLGRTERALDTVLERDLPDWRSHYVMEFDPRAVIEIRRTGSLDVPGDEPLELGLEAVLDGEWRATSPFIALLDPRVVGTMIGSVATMRADAFIDTPGPLEYYGLATPKVRIEMHDARGSTQVLRLSPEPAGEMWYATREDQPYVYRVSALAASLCFAPTEGMVERSLARVARNDVQKLEVGCDGRSFALERRGRGWVVSGREGERVTLHEAPADDALAADALATIEQARMDELDFDGGWDADETRGFVRLSTVERTFGGALGATVRTADGVEGVRFRREGDSVFGLLSMKVLELAQRDAASFRSLALHKVLELDVARIEVSSGAAKRTWVRNEAGRWVREGSSLEAKEFARQVDRLLSMRAQEMLLRGDDRLENPLEVQVIPYSGPATVFTLAKSEVEGAEATVYRTGELYATVGAEPYRSLLDLVSAP